MPELPEVEVTRQGLAAQLLGRTVVALAWSGYRLRSEIPIDALQRHILGQGIQAIDRRAKYLLVRMLGGAVLVLHLGMTGKLGLMVQETPRHQHDHLLLALDDGRELRFNDSRRFGMIAVWPAECAAQTERDFSAREGIEPFAPEWNATQLHQLFGAKRTPIKSLLMNGRLIAGIGNIYANEILFAARIHPLSPASHLQRDDWQRIVIEGQRILRQAIAAGGSTIADFLGTSGQPGYFQLHFTVYSRKGCPCPQCAQPISKTTSAGRATYFCPACQVLG
jgi:formamidopyrimidine-DNA glycosylase